MTNHPPTPQSELSMPEQPTALPTKPDNLSDECWNAQTGQPNSTALIEHYTKTQKIAKDLRARISKGLGGDVPESADDYHVALSADAAKYIPQDGQGLTIAKQAALAAGIPNQAFGTFIQSYADGLMQQGVLDDSILPKTEEQIAQEDEAFRAQEMAKLGQDGQRLLDTLSKKVTTLYQNGTLNDADMEAFKQAAYDADGVLFLNKWITLNTNTQTIPTHHATDQTPLTKAQLDAMAADPQMQDPTFRAKRSAGYRALEERGALDGF